MILSPTPTTSTTPTHHLLTRLLILGILAWMLAACRGTTLPSPSKPAEPITLQKTPPLLPAMETALPATTPSNSTATAIPNATPAGPPFVIQGDGGALQDPFVSKAVLVAVDWSALQALFANVAPAPVLLPGLEGTTTDDFEYDPAYARQVLAESGAAQGTLSLFLVTPPQEVYRHAAERLQRYWGEIGITTSIHITEHIATAELLAELEASGRGVIWLGPKIPEE